MVAVSICPQRAMWSKTWAVALAIVSRLTVTDCFGPPLNRPYNSAERVRDPDREIDDAIRMREELARENVLKHLKLPIQTGVSDTEVEYADDAAQPRHRYYGNKYHSRPHLPPDEQPPEMNSNHHQRFPLNSFQGPKNVPTHLDHHHQAHGHGALRGQPYGSNANDLESPEESELKQSARGVKTAPNVQLRSGVESFQPIAAAIAMQENLNALDEAAVNTPPPASEQPPSVDHKLEIQPEPPHLQVISKTIDSDYSENEILEKEHDQGMRLDPKEVQAALQQSEISRRDGEKASLTEVYFLAVIAGCSVAGFMGLVLAGVCYYRLRKKVKDTSDVEYPAYGVTGPNKEREGGAPGDRKLAQSAQMYHYQHQKQQMIASERLNSDVNHRGGSDAESEDENEEGDYTVFECPGLATNGDMEVRNPLFNEQTPVTAPSDISGTQGKK